MYIQMYVSETRVIRVIPPLFFFAGHEPLLYICAHAILSIEQYIDMEREQIISSPLT